MNNNRWKDKYYDANGISVSENGLKTSYLSILGQANGVGTPIDPILPKSQVFSNNNYILSSGIFNSLQFEKSHNAYLHIIGQGIDKTIIKQIKEFANGGGMESIQNVTIINSKGSNFAHINCKLSKFFENDSGTYSHCIMEFPSQRSQKRCSLNNLSVIYDAGYSNLNAIANSDVILNQDKINTFRNNYLGFDSCRFRLGNEQEYTELTGNTEQELRDNFVARCTAQNILVPDITEYGETLKLGRWVFSKNSTIEGQVVKDSIIDRFQKRRAIKLGYSDNVIENIPISVEKTSAHSISVDNVDNNLVIENGSIHFDSETSITDKKECVVDSKIIWLGGKQRISSIDIMNNLPMNYGVMIDNTLSLSDNPVLSTAIESNKNYLIRSANNDRATITYNGKTYTSSLSEKNNIFRGIDGQESFADISGNAQVFEALDYAVQQTIQMRIVDNLPAQKITSGSLQTGYWYYIAPDDLSDASGTIEYNGDNYPCYSSFIATDTSSIAVNGACHLRRCWHKDFDFDSEATDKAFWQEIQKPKWIDIVPNDLRCLKKNNSEYTIEMAMDSNGEYITSGHPDFYSLITGESGIPTPSFNITGSFMQLRLVISTLNPM